MGKKEIVFGALLMIVCAIVFALTFQFPKQTLALSPRVFPRVVSVCLFILAAILCVQGILGMQKASGQTPSPVSLNKTFLLRFFLMIIVAFLYIKVLPITGYLIATPPLVAGAMLLFGEKRWGWIIVVSLVTSATLLVIFRMVFKVPLPRFNLW